MATETGVIWTIRHADAQDVAQLSALARKTYSETFGDSFSDEELMEVLETTRSESYFSQAMEQDTILVAVDYKGDLIAYIQICDVTLSFDIATTKDQQLNALYVHSDWQGRGVGKSLMDAALSHPRLQTAENVYLTVWDENPRALGLYHRFGFKIVGEEKVMAGSEVVGSDLVMMRPLVLQI